MEAELLHADGEKNGRTEGHEESNSRFSQFCECDYKWFKFKASALLVRRVFNDG